MLLMAENPDIIETLTKHLPGLRIYQAKIFSITPSKRHLENKTVEENCKALNELFGKWHGQEKSFWEACSTPKTVSMEIKSKEVILKDFGKGLEDVEKSPF